MKILSAEYFPIAPTVDTDSLTLITSILVNRQLRDRFDVLNKYSNVRWASGSDPVPTPITTPMVELLDAHATSVIQQYDGDASKPIVVLWSGGGFPTKGTMTGSITTFPMLRFRLALERLALHVQTGEPVIMAEI